MHRRQKVKCETPVYLSSNQDQEVVLTPVRPLRTKQINRENDHANNEKNKAQLPIKMQLDTEQMKHTLI